MASSARTAFLDRDGTINRKPPEGDYVKSWQEFAWLPGALEAIRLLKEEGWRVIVVTNQRGVALGRMRAEDVEQIHHRMLAQAPIDAVYTCPHELHTCDCRKPRVGLFLDAQHDFPDIDFARSVVIGDTRSDMEAGERIGARTVQVGERPLPSLLQAVERLVEQEV